MVQYFSSGYILRHSVSETKRYFCRLFLKGTKSFINGSATQFKRLALTAKAFILKFHDVLCFKVVTKCKWHKLEKCSTLQGLNVTVFLQCRPFFTVDVTTFKDHSIIHWCIVMWHFLYLHCKSSSIWVVCLSLMIFIQWQLRITFVFTNQLWLQCPISRKLLQRS